MIRAKYYAASDDLDLLAWLARRSGEPDTIEGARLVCGSYGVVAEVRDDDGALLGYIGPGGYWWPTRGSE